MKNYKRTIKKLKRNEKYVIKFLKRIVVKIQKDSSEMKPGFHLRLIQIKRRFMDGGLLELLLMNQLEQKRQEQEDRKLKGSNVVKFRKIKK